MEATRKRKTQESVLIKDPNTGFEISYSITSRLKRNLDIHVIDALKKSLDDDIDIIEVEADINTPQFARAVVDALHQVLDQK